MLVGIVYNKIYKSELEKSIEIDLLDYMILMYLISNIVSSALFSPTPQQSLKSCLTIASYILIYYVTKEYSFRLHDQEKVIEIVYVLNLCSMIIGISFFILSISEILHENIGITFDNLKADLPSIRSLSFEPNLFAVTTATIGGLSFAAIISEIKKYRHPITIILIIISIMLTFTRSVYFALPFAVFVSLIIFSKSIFRNLWKYGIIILIGIVIYDVVFSKSESLDSLLVERVTSIFDFESGSGAARVLGYEIAFNSFVDHPILGNGTNTAATEFYNQYTGEVENLHATKGYLSGAWIQSLHDTGIIGFIITMSIFAVSITMNYKAYKNSNTKEYKTIFMGFFIGNIVIAISSQLTSSLFISFPWIYWGINTALIQKIKNEPIKTVLLN